MLPQERALLQPEASWTQTVLDLARRLGWRRYHTWLALHSASGFPDVVLCKPPRLILAELKRDDVLDLEPAQEAWAADLRQCPGCEYYVWRPRDAQTVADILQALGAPLEG